MTKMNEGPGRSTGETRQDRPVAPVVTLFESYGSGAATVGPAVARALDVPFHEEALSSSQLEEHAQEGQKKGLLPRLSNAMRSPFLVRAGVGKVSSAQRDRYQLTVQNTAQVRSWAEEGGVIVGHNATMILGDRPGTLHVRLDGMVGQRIARAAREADISIERAVRRQKIEDRIRRIMSVKLYDWDPRDLTRYDLVVNTGRMDLDTCVKIIVAAWRIRTGHHAS